MASKSFVKIIVSDSAPGDEVLNQSSVVPESNIKNESDGSKSNQLKSDMKKPSIPNKNLEKGLNF